MDDEPKSLRFDIDADTSKLRDALQDVDQIGQRFSRTLMTAFEDVAVRGRKLDDVIKSVGLRLSQLALKAALKPLEETFSSGFSSLFSGLPGLAIGDAARPRMELPLAAGGIVTSAPEAQFRAGLESIVGEGSRSNVMRSISSGIGLAGAGAGGAMQVTFNVSTSDAQSFQRSEAQIGAMLSRVIARGERNL